MVVVVWWGGVRGCPTGTAGLAGPGILAEKSPGDRGRCCWECPGGQEAGEMRLHCPWGPTAHPRVSPEPGTFPPAGPSRLRPRAQVPSQVTTRTDLKEILLSVHLCPSAPLFFVTGQLVRTQVLSAPSPAFLPVSARLQGCESGSAAPLPAKGDRKRPAGPQQADSRAAQVWEQVGGAPGECAGGAGLRYRPGQPHPRGWSNRGGERGRRFLPRGTCHMPR